MLLIPGISEVATQTIVGMVKSRVCSGKCLKCDSAIYSLGLCQRHYRRFRWLLDRCKSIKAQVQLWVANMREGHVLSMGDSKTLRREQEFVGG